jgi:hypothetical protein
VALGEPVLLAWLLPDEAATVWLEGLLPCPIFAGPPGAPGGGGG